MLLASISPWAGAVAGLRIVVAFQAACAVCAYRPVVVRMFGRGFACSRADLMGSVIAFLALAQLMQSSFGLALIARDGFVPADAVLWSRLVVAGSSAVASIAFTILFAGFATRNSGIRQGKLMYLRIATIAVAMMALGAVLPRLPLIVAAWR